MHLKGSQNVFVFITFLLFTLLQAVAMKTEGSLSRLPYTLSKIHHKILNLYNL